MIREIHEWNRIRDNLEYNRQHELDMLNEEFTEYAYATDIANEAKEIADIIFVAIGSLCKLVGPKKAHAVIDTVIMHNQAKTGEKINGKVTKQGVSWKAEDRIQEILEQTRPVQTTMDKILYKGE